MEPTEAGKQLSPFTVLRALKRRKLYLLVPVLLVTGAASVYTLRRVLARMPSLDSMPLLIDRLEKTNSNAEFLGSFRVDE